MPTIKPRIPFLIFCLDDDQNGASLWKNDTFQQLFDRVGPHLYPSEGLWPEKDQALPTNLSRTESNAIRNFALALKTKQSEDVLEWRRFQRDSLSDEHRTGRKAATRIFERLMKMAKVSGKLDRVLLQKNFHPAALASRGLPTELDIHRSAVRSILGEALWGPEAVDPVFNILHRQYEAVTDGFLGASWGRLRRKAEAWKANWERKLQEMEEAWARLEEGPMTRSTVSKAVKQCNALLSQATLMHDEVVLTKAGQHLTRLEEVMAGLEETRSTGPVLKTARRGCLHPGFATDEEIQAALAEYYDLFHTHPVTPQLVRDLPEITGDTAALDPFSDLKEEELWLLLGLDGENGQVPFFKEHLPSSYPSSSSHPENLELCRLRWSQLVGVAAMIHMWTRDESPLDRRSILLADEVGVGKTGTVMGAIAVYIHARKLQERGNPLPPIFNGHGWGTTDTLPDAPWLIICPAGLVENWRREFERFFKKGAVRLFNYTGTHSSHRNFWASGSEWQQNPAGLGEYQKVIICSTSALASDAAACLDLHKTMSPASQARIKRARAGPSIFDVQWAGVTFDEAHELRTRNTKFEAMTNIRENTYTMVLATATPLFTGPQDLLNLQRIAGLGEYGAPADALEKEVRGQKRHLERARHLGKEHVEEARSSLNSSCQISVEKIKKEFRGRIIRRTPFSKKWDGSSLLSLPPLHHCTAFISLSAKERHALDEIREEASGETGTSEFTSKAFYTRYRTTISHYLLARGDRVDLPETLVEWKEIQSTKFNQIVRLITHLLQDDDCSKELADPVTGEFRIPTCQHSPSPMQTDKVVIYQEYMSHAPLLRKVLELHGIQALVMNGLVGVREREEVMKKFNQEGGPRVLIMSRVGTTGLNMSRANHIIISDLQWAEQDNKQAVGRVWRYPQRKTVYAYYLAARDTTDEMIAKVAGAKGVLLGKFFDDEILSPLAQFLDENHPLTEAQADRSLETALIEERDDDQLEAAEENRRTCAKKRARNQRGAQKGPDKNTRPVQTVKRKLLADDEEGRANAKVRRVNEDDEGCGSSHPVSLRFPKGKEKCASDLSAEDICVGKTDGGTHRAPVLARERTPASRRPSLEPTRSNGSAAGNVAEVAPTSANPLPRGSQRDEPTCLSDSAAGNVDEAPAIPPLPIRSQRKTLWEPRVKKAPLSVAPIASAASPVDQPEWDALENFASSSKAPVPDRGQGLSRFSSGTSSQVLPPAKGEVSNPYIVRENPFKIKRSLTEAKDQRKKDIMAALRRAK